MEYVDFDEWQIDELGQIWRTKVRVKGDETHTVPRKRAERLNNSGYLYVAGTIDGVRYRCLAHRLVWQSLHGDIPAGLVINHKNGVKTDNSPGNLEVCTQAENLAHAVRTGLRRPRRVAVSHG